ncbi:discoidin domain-containing protein [Streptomyces sp. NPDC017179]|uniref:discoidin domain-containing protein n=1 Tax=Streptomyces sp. NPDC017179 TaxID=3364979 RepID=UPI00379BF4AC
MASSVENDTFPASAAVDGDTGTRWSSAFSDPQWLRVDLGSVQQLTRVTLNWEAAYAKSFQIQTSTDTSTWTTVHSTTNATGGTQNLAVAGSGRYVRVYGTARATPYAHSRAVAGDGQQAGTGQRLNPRPQLVVETSTCRRVSPAR